MIFHRSFWSFSKIGLSFEPFEHDAKAIVMKMRTKKLKMNVRDFALNDI